MRRRRWSRYTIEVRILRILRPLTIAFLVVITVFPFYYMVMLSLRDISEVLQDPGRLIPPLSQLSLAPFESVLKSVGQGGQGFTRFLVNSAELATATVIVTLAVSILGAYAVARLNFFGRRHVSVLFLSIYLFPPVLLAIPLFVLFSRLGLRGQLPVLVIVYVAQTVPVCVYMLRNYFQTVPRSLEEAAEIDGATRIGVIRHVTLPLAKPAIAATAMLVFMVAWNEFLFALLFLADHPSHWTVSLGLNQLENIETPKTVLMAGSVIITLPVIVLFLAAERFITGGLTQGAEKG
jgi:multiple sugar transport system permease protein